MYGPQGESEAFSGLFRGDFPAQDGGLLRSETWWRDRYFDLETKGYRLRRRYHPDWEPSWKKSGKEMFDTEDGQFDPVSILYLVYLAVQPDNFVQLRASMDAVRIEDGRQVMLKKVPERSPNELEIIGWFSSPELREDPRNHCVPLLDVVKLSQPSPDCNQLMVSPLLRPFENPRLQTYGEFVAFFMQISEVGPNACRI